MTVMRVEQCVNCGRTEVCKHGEHEGDDHWFCSTFCYEQWIETEEQIEATQKPRCLKCKERITKHAFDLGLCLCPDCLTEQINIAFANPEAAGVDE